MANEKFLKYEILGEKQDIAYIKYDDIIIYDISSALDLMSTVRYETNCDKIVLDKSNFNEDFFILSKKIAGEILQKYINYNFKMAIVGDFSTYTSKPLKDFIRESNAGKDFFFISSLEDAVKCLSQ